MPDSFEEIRLDTPPDCVFDTMNEYRKKNLFCDVTLDTNGTLFPCHRLVLTVSSTYFQVMFNGNFKESSLETIPIQDIDAEVMEILLSAIYTRRIRLFPNNAYFVLKASHLLQCDTIFNACVDIIKNATEVHMHYLPETCAFAKTIGAEKLYDACIARLAGTLILWGIADGFLDLSYDIFKDVLSKVKPVKIYDHDILAVIIKWCKYNDSSAKDIRTLLQVPTFSKKLIWTSAVAELMVAARSEDSSRSAEYGIQSDNGDCSFNIYVNAVDVKSGATGWGRLKLNESFDNYTLSNFHTAGPSYNRFCTIGTKTYRFELNYFTGKFDFSCFEENGRIDLQVPNGLDWCNSRPTEMIAAEKMIYLFHGRSSPNIWVYNCELDTWEYNSFQVPSQDSFKSVLCNYSQWFDVTFLDNVFYVVGCKNYSTKSAGRYIVAIDSRAPQIKNCIAFPNPFRHRNAGVCAFDRKIAISGSGSHHDDNVYNTFSIFDVTANKWRTDLEPMNEDRQRHRLIYRNGFIYAVDRRPFTVNEKYDVKLNTWIEIPKLPERAQFINADGVNTTVGFLNVINAESISM